ncbi:MAG TPA: FtsQ-type POTRA domain-containing protein [Acidobacteriaceae bacterium]|nr:FtsQ-type POTRA domain-containing protein [Acidobacteriaceae bacterium]
MGSKRGAGVLDAPEEESTYEVETPRRRAARVARKSSYAPQEGPAPDDYADEYDEPAFKRQGGLKLKVRRGLPKSWIGRGLFAVGLLMVLGVFFATFAAARSALLHDSHFVMTTSEDVQIVGNHNVTREMVLSVFGADLERNIFRVPLDERRADLERLPWVAHATVMRLLPNRIRIAVTERTPVAFVRHGSQIGLVDAGGVLLDMPQDAAGDPHYSFPVLTGLSVNDPLSTRAARMAIFQRFMQELDSAGQKNSSTISEVDVSNPEDVKAVVSGGGSDILVHFGDEQFLHRYQEFEQHLPEWKQQYPKLAAADMRYERQVVLEMQPGTGVPLVGDSGASDAAAESASAAPAAPVVSAPKTHVNSPKAAVKPVSKQVSHTSTAAAKAKATTSAGKTKTGNGKIFADLAAARRAKVARGKPAAAGAQ